MMMMCTGGTGSRRKIIVVAWKTALWPLAANLSEAGTPSRCERGEFIYSHLTDELLTLLRLHFLTCSVSMHRFWQAPLP